MKMSKVFSSFVLFFTLVISSPLFAESFLSTMTDSVNSGIINVQMMTDKTLSNTHVDATVVNGVAIFSGEVNTKQQVDELIRIAHSVSGIKSVDISKLKILIPDELGKPTKIKIINNK